jgi:hypothetical protein
MAKQGSLPPVPIWRGADYARVSAGSYQAIAIRHQGPEWIRPFSRWSLLVEFELLDDGALVCAFYNFGSNRGGPEVMRRGNYFKAWTLANGELPRKGQLMSPDVFLDGQIFTVEVKDSRKDPAETEKADAEIYSKVTAILNVNACAAITNPLIRNHESGIMQSPNQAINQSGLASTAKSAAPN